MQRDRERARLTRTLTMALRLSDKYMHRMESTGLFCPLLISHNKIVFI